MNTEITFSVVIPLYNCRDYIHEAVTSVLDQTFCDFEIIVIDDGSTDGSDEVVKAFDDPRIRYFRQENQGVSAARNAGIEQAQGRFVAFLDADDYWHKQHLEQAREAFLQWDVNWYISDYRKTSERYCAENLQPYAPGNSALKLVDYCRKGFQFVCSSSVVIRREALETLRFKNGLQLGEDLLFWYSFAVKNPHVVISENITAFYYSRRNSACNTVVTNDSLPLENVCKLMIEQKIPDKNNFLFAVNIYVMFYRNLSNFGRKSALSTLKKYGKYLGNDIKIVFFATIFISLIHKNKAAGIALRYLRWRGIIRPLAVTKVS